MIVFTIRTREQSGVFLIQSWAADSVLITRIEWSKRGLAVQAIAPGSRHATHEKTENRDRRPKPRDRKTVSDRKSARRGRIRMYVSSPETRFLGQANQELLPQNHHGPRKLASRGLFWRVAESLRACDSVVRFLSALSGDQAASLCSIVRSSSMRSTERSAIIWPRPSGVGRRCVRVGKSVALLKLLDQLHGAGALHRDITPTNVFVCKNKKLKLGDFGLARTVLAGKMLAASAFTPFFVSKRMAEGERRHWLPSDDVFQMGQLLAMLLRGDAESVISAKDAGELPVQS